jgi:putative transposase
VCPVHGRPEASSAGHLGADRWRAVITSLEGVRAGGGALTAAVGDAAARLGVARGTVWAHLAKGSQAQQRRTRARFTLGDDERREVYAAGGNVAAVTRTRVSADVGGPGLRTWQRAVARDMCEMERVNAAQGWRVARTHGLFWQLQVPHRNTVWQTDHKQLGVTVVLPNATSVKPWVTVFIDVSTKVVMGWAIDVRPTETTVTCALRRALQTTPFRSVGEEPEVVFGGAPTTVVLDNGLEFAAGGLTAAAAELSISLDWCPPYTPHRKGAVERFNRTADQLLLSQLPFFDAGPRKADGTLYGAAGAMLTLAELVALFEHWIEDYHHRPHAGLAGRSPRQAWAADATPLRGVDDEQLRGLLHRDRRMIGKYGIRLNNVYYLPPKLFGNRRRVEIRYDVHAPTELLVYLDGIYADTAFPQHTATPEQVAVFRAEKAKLVKRMRNDRARATRLMRARIHPMSVAGAVRDAAVLSVEAAAIRYTHPTQNGRARAKATTSLRPIDCDPPNLPAATTTTAVDGTS